MAEEPYRGSDQERADQLRSRGYPQFVKQGARWAWTRTLAILAEQNALEDPITPKNWAAANAIYMRILKKHAPSEAENLRIKQLAERASVSTIDPALIARFNEHKRSEILELDIGGWYLTRAGLMAHEDDVTERLFWDTPFVRLMPRENADPLALEPNHYLGREPLTGWRPNTLVVQALFCWTVERYTEELAWGKAIVKITPEIASYLVRDCGEAPAWMAKQMRDSLSLIDEAILDVEHEMPTVAGIEVPSSILDHRTTKELLRHGKAAIENAINALPDRR